MLAQSFGATVDRVARLGLVLNAFGDLIDNGASIHNLKDGIVDYFFDQSGVDNAAVSGLAHDSRTASYHVVFKDIVSSRGTAISGGDNWPKAQALDGNPETGWMSLHGGSAMLNKDYIGVDFGTPRTATGMSITVNSFNMRPSTVKAQYWDRNIWRDVPGGFLALTHAGTSWISFASVASRKFRWLMTGLRTDGWTGYPVVVHEIQVVNEVDGMILPSVAFQAAKPPRAVRAVVLVSRFAGALGTDLIVEASADGGATWTALALDDEGEFGSGVSIVSGVGVPGGSGTSMKYRVRTLHRKMAIVHGVALQWGG